MQLKLNNSSVQFTQVHRISHESAGESKKKMAAGKSYYRYWHISCNERKEQEENDMGENDIYVYMSICHMFPMLKQKTGLQANKS